MFLWGRWYYVLWYYVLCTYSPVYLEGALHVNLLKREKDDKHLSNVIQGDIGVSPKEQNQTPSDIVVDCSKETPCILPKQEIHNESILSGKFIVRIFFSDQDIPANSRWRFSVCQLYLASCSF